MKRLAILGISFLLSCSVCLHAQTQAEIANYFDSMSKRTTTLIGHSMPSYQSYDAENLKNRITFINFWFETCAPCIAEMEALNNLYANFKDAKNFRFMSFTFEKTEDVRRISDKYSIKYPISTIPHDSCYVLNLRGGFPTSIITDTAGKVAYYFSGGPGDPVKAKEHVTKDIYPVLEKLLR